MTTPPADVPAPPPTCEDLYDEARARPKSLRLLPGIIRDAVRLVRAAAPRELAISIVLKLISGAGLALVFLMGKNLMATLLTDGQQLPRTGRRTPEDPCRRCPHLRTRPDRGRRPGGPRGLV